MTSQDSGSSNDCTEANRPVIVASTPTSGPPGTTVTIAGAWRSGEGIRAQCCWRHADSYAAYACYRSATVVSNGNIACVAPQLASSYPGVAMPSRGDTVAISVHVWHSESTATSLQHAVCWSLREHAARFTYTPCSLNASCPVGRYHAGVDCSASCIECTNAPAGTHYTGDGGLSNTCPYSACEGSCPVGHYRRDCGITNAGICTECTNAPAGRDYTGDGGLTNNCPHAAASTVSTTSTRSSSVDEQVDDPCDVFSRGYDPCDPECGGSPSDPGCCGPDPCSARCGHDPCNGHPAPGCGGCPDESTELPITRSTSASSSSIPAVACARNCGQPENGGGTCRSNGRCTSCNSDRVLQGGRCYSSIACKGRRIQTGSQTGSSCRCLEAHCHYCNRVAAGDTCRVCRDGWYLMDGACLETCPANRASSGVNLFKRRCLEPFTCRSNRIEGQDVPYGCRCANEDNTAIASCQICEFRVGEFGQHCLRCNGGTFLHNNRCYWDCFDAEGLVEYAPGNYGRECREPFTCTARLDEDNRACRCPRSVGKDGCAVCDFTFEGATCSRCTNGKYLQNGVCVDACSGGAVGIGSSRDGRECQ